MNREIVEINLIDIEIVLMFCVSQQMPNAPSMEFPANRLSSSHRHRSYRIWVHPHWNWRKYWIWLQLLWQIKHRWRPLLICSENWACAKHSSHIMGESDFHAANNDPNSNFLCLFILPPAVCWASSQRKMFCGTWNKWTTKIQTRFFSIKQK